MRRIKLCLFDRSPFLVPRSQIVIVLELVLGFSRFFWFRLISERQESRTRTILEHGKDPVPFSSNLRNLRFTSSLRFSGLVGVSTTTRLTKTVSQPGPALNRTGDSSAQYRF